MTQGRGCRRSSPEAFARAVDHPFGLLKTGAPGYYRRLMRRSVTAGVVAAIGSALCFVGCTVERPQPNLVGQDIHLTIIHTSDIHSRLFPYNFVPNTFDQDYGLLPTNAPFGGIARIATLVKRIRRESARSLWLDSGDAFQGAPVFNMFKGE